MVDIYETAYPRFKSSLTPEEVKSTYTPTVEERLFAKNNTYNNSNYIYFLIMLKSIQRLGYFPMVKDIPAPIISFIKSFGKSKLYVKILYDIDNSTNRLRCLDRIREYLKIKSIGNLTTKAMELAARKAAITKQELPDIVNIMIEELIRQNFELPGFTTIHRIAQTIKNQVNDEYYSNISNTLTQEQISQLDTLLIVDKDTKSSNWYRLKQESKKPTNKEVKQYLEHIQWLKNLVNNMPEINYIPVSKRLQFTHEARALNVSQMKELKTNKRYALILILLHAQLSRTLDDIVEILIKKIRKLHLVAEELLKLYFIEHQKRAEKLIIQLRDVLEAFQEGQSPEERGELVAGVIHSDPTLLLAECEEHIAYSGNNYIPFLIRPFQPQRQLLLNCLSLLELKATSSDQSLIRAIQFVLEHRSSHKKFLDYPLENGSLRWIPDKWRKFIFEHPSKPSRTINRKYFELCV